MRFTTQVMVSAVLLVALISACSDDKNNDNSGGGNSVQISGSIGSGYTSASAPKGFFGRVMSWLGIGSHAYAAAGDPVVDTVVALRVDRGSLTSDGMINRHEAVIDADGSFSLVLDKDYDWLMVLMNSAETGTDRFVGSVTISPASGAGARLLNLPLSAAAVGSINLGTISRETSSLGLGTISDAVASNEVSTVDFSMTAEQLIALAKTDDVFRNAKNIITNYDTETDVWYTIRPDFSWTNDSNVGGEYSDPMYSVSSGYGWQMDTNSESVTIQNICATDSSKIDVGFYPPVDIVSNLTTTYGPSNGMTNNNVTECYVEQGNTNAKDEDFFVGDGGWTDKQLAYSFSAVQFPLPLPEGDWIWKEAGQNKAYFDLVISAPSTSTGLQTGFVPSIMITLGSDGFVSVVDVKWSYYDEATGSYVDVPTGDASLTHAVRVAEIGFYEMGQDTNTVEKIMFDPASKSSINPADTWSLSMSAPSGTKQLGHINIFYETGGIGRVIIFTGIPQ